MSFLVAFSEFFFRRNSVVVMLIFARPFMHSVLTRRRVLVLYKNLCDATQASSQLCDQLLLFYDVLWVSCKSFVSSNGTINCSKNQLTIKELEKKKKNSTPKKSIASDKERQRRL